MKSEERSQAFLRKRKMLLVLPLLTIPFLTMAFWALGGGQGNATQKPKDGVGLNLNLPSSDLKGSAEDKMSFYDKEAKDSMKLEEMMREDPYYKSRRDSVAPTSANEVEDIAQNTANKFGQKLNPSPYGSSTDDPEKKLMEKLSKLQSVINTPTDREDTGELAAQMNRLEGMMQGVGTGGSEDPEMGQLSNTLDKILDIQHPDRVKERLKEKSLQNKRAAYAVTTPSTEAGVNFFGSTKEKTKSNAGFFATMNGDTNTNDETTIKATVNGQQTLVNGAVVKLRLLTDVLVNGKSIPQGTFISGVTSLNDERLNIAVSAIQYKGSILPIELSVYDLDGLEGIHIPGAINRDVAKQSADNSLQLLELSSMDPSLKAQATAAGIGAAKSLLSQKVKQIKVTLKAGYKVLLKNKAE